MVRWLTLCFGLVVLSACANTRAVNQSDAPTLPNLGSLVNLRKNASASRVQLGSAFVSSGGAVSVQVDTALFQPADSEFAWAVYEFAIPDTVALQSISYSLERPDSVGTTWLAISDFAQGSWRVLSVSEPSGVFELKDPAGTFSNGEAVFVALLSHGAELTLNLVALSVSGPIWQHSFGISGMYGGYASQKLNSSGVYVAAVFYAAGEIRSAVMRYGLDGTLLTSAMTPLGYRSSALATVPDGTAYWTLYSEDLYEQYVLKLDGNLNTVWALQYDAGGYESFQSAEVDPATHDVILVGDSVVQEVTGYPKVIVRISPSGEIVWQRGLPETSHLYLPHLNIDSASGDIFAGGHWGMFDADWVWFRWDSAGNLLQYTNVIEPYQGPSDGHGLNGGMVRDSAGNLFLCATGNGGMNPHYLLKFDPLGVLSKAIEFDWAGFPDGLSLGSNETIRVHGQELTLAFDEDLIPVSTVSGPRGKFFDYADAAYLVKTNAAQWPLPQLLATEVITTDITSQIEFDTSYTPVFVDMAGSLLPAEITLEPFNGPLDQFSSSDVGVGSLYMP